MLFEREAIIIDEFLKEKEKRGRFSGVVYIKHKDETLVSSTYGFANRTFNVKNELNTKFRVASIGKLFTAAAIITLVKEGKIVTDEKISHYLDLSDSKIPDDVTVFHLLTNTSGIGDYYDEEEAEDGDWEALWENKPIYTMRTLNDYYELFKDKEPVFNAGEEFLYSGAGYILLGMLIEKITSKPYDEYIKEAVIDKLGLKNTAFLDNEIVVPNVADGYEPIFDEAEEEIIGYKKNIFTLTPLPAADGGITTTAEDLLRFGRAIRNNELFEEKYTRLILEPKVLDQEPTDDDEYTWKYGFGCWSLLLDDKIVRYAVTGEEFGVSARLYYYPEQDIDVILLGNIGFCTGSVSWEIHDLIVGNK